MKRYFTIIFMFFFISMSVNAQKDIRYKEVAGRYGGLDGFFLFDDGTFLLYGYATMIPGKYTFNKKSIKFVPLKPKYQFIVLATKNPNIQGSVINFKGFEEGNTYVQFDDQKMMRVFNKNPNCFESQYVYETASVPQKITFARLDSDMDEPSVYATNSLMFDNAQQFNDFIVFYKKETPYLKPFEAVVEGKNDKRQLITYEYGEYPLNPTPMQDEDSQYFFKVKESIKNEDDIEPYYWANALYKIFDNGQINDVKEYIFLEKNNLYVQRDQYQPQTDYGKPYQIDYDDKSVLKKYMSVQPSKVLKLETKNAVLSDSTIFYTTCEEPEKSYKYISKYKILQNQHDSAPLLLEPLPQLPVMLKSDNIDPGVEEKEPVSAYFQPFDVELKDGFYAVKNKTWTYRKEDLSPKMQMSFSEIISVEKVTDDFDRPQIEIKLNPKGAAEFAQLTRENIGKPIAIVVRGKVIYMPIVNEEIREGGLTISGLDTLEECNKILNHLKTNINKK